MMAESGRQCIQLQDGLSALQFGDHLYYPYEKATSQLPALTSFIRVGLKLGHQCIHVADDLPEDTVVKALQAVGVDTEAKIGRGALHFLTKWQWRHQAEFDPALMVKGLASLVAKAHLAGFSGTRIWGDMTWTLNPGVDPLQLEAWETLLHRIIQNEPVIITCSYNRRRLPASIIKAGENTHPLHIAGGRVLPNDRSRLAALFAKHGSLLRRLDPPSRPRLVDPG